MAEILAFLLIGVAAGRLQAAESTILDRTILDWLLPLTIVFSMSRVEWGLHSAMVVGLCVVVTVVDAFLVVIASRVFGIQGTARRTLLLMTPLGNTAYFGFAAVTALLGPSFLPDAILFDQLGTTLMLVTYGNSIARASGMRVSRDDLIELMRFRPLWGLGFGIVLDAVGVDLLSGLTRSLGLAITGSLLPVSMIALGSKLSTRGLKKCREVVIGVSIRVVIGPSLVIGMVILATAGESSINAALLETAMPSMVAAALLAERSKLDAGLAYSLCVVGIPVACAMLPVYSWFLA